MSESTAESGSTTRDSHGLVAALTTDAQAFGHRPNALVDLRGLGQLFSKGREKTRRQ